MSQYIEILRLDMTGSWQLKIDEMRCIISHGVLSGKLMIKSRSSNVKRHPVSI